MLTTALRAHCGKFSDANGNVKILVGDRENSAILDIDEGLWVPGVPFPEIVEGPAVVQNFADFTVIGGAALVDNRPSPSDLVARFDGKNMEWVEEGRIDVGRWDSVAINFEANDYCQ